MYEEVLALKKLFQVNQRFALMTGCYEIQMLNGATPMPMPGNMMLVNKEFI